MADNEDVNVLKRRSRRRLVGAIALVLAAVIVLPMVFDSEPKRGAPPVSVRIPGEDETAFSPKLAAKPPVEKATEKPAEKIPEKAVESAPEKPAPGADAERARAEAALSGTQFIVPVAALASAEKLRELLASLKAAQLPYYTEPIATKQGPVTRVRAGPFASREAAEKALQQIKELGLKPGNVATKS